MKKNRWHFRKPDGSWTWADTPRVVRGWVIDHLVRVPHIGGPIELCRIPPGFYWCGGGSEEADGNHYASFHQCDESGSPRPFSGRIRSPEHD